MKDLLKIAKSLFEGWVILTFISLYSILSGLYVFQISKSIILGIILGVIGGCILFYAINIIAKEMNNKQREMEALNKYVTIVVFNLKTGANVLDSLRFAYDKVDDVIKPDLRVAINSITDTGEIDLSAFERHNFTALDIFHNNLGIIYSEGGDPNEIFRSTTEDINDEISKRDRLYRNKKYIMQEEYMAIGIFASIPVVLSTVGVLYKDYLSIPIAPYALTIFAFGGIVFTILQMNRRKRDIEVTL